MSKFIISYRENDSKSFTHRLSDFLLNHFKETEVQLGLKGVIQPGDDFIEAISTALDKAEVLLVVVGDQWLDGDWLQDDHDFDNIALKTAIDQNIQIMPVLMNNATMPSTTDLPDSLGKFARRIGIRIDEADFRNDAKTLVDLLLQKVEADAPKVANTPSPQPQATDAQSISSPAQDDVVSSSTVKQTSTPAIPSNEVPDYMEARYERQRKRFYVPPIITLLLMLLPWAVVVQSCGSYDLGWGSNDDRENYPPATVTGVQLAMGEGAEFIEEPNTNIIILAVTCAVMLGVLFIKIDGTSVIMIILALIGSFFALGSSSGSGYHAQTLLAQGVAVLLMLAQLIMAIWNSLRNVMIQRNRHKTTS